MSAPGRHGSASPFFTLAHRDATTGARAGIVHTGHGDIPTPVFMPVGTQGTVKAVEQRELVDIGARIILANTYHLALRPGADFLRERGGLHRFMAWNGAMLTDSGGYQVYSLAQLRRIEQSGVTFRSHIDGSVHRFTPESVIDIQRDIGSDIMMILDECPAADCGYEYAARSAELTLRWAAQAREHLGKTVPHYGHTQAAFGIVQGNVFQDLRLRNAEGLIALDFDGYAIGGLAVGEDIDTMYEVTGYTAAALPAHKPRYLMGVGTPLNIVEAVSRGVDMFDCVMPTRDGRHGLLFTFDGPLPIDKERFARDEAPIDAQCGCYACATFSRAYLRHLFHVRETLAMQLASQHNLAFYLQLTRDMRNAILGDVFSGWKQQFIARYTSGTHAA
ncbi:MAG: tRNA guanosine(34) transglycosylase Tgt [Ignavibacteriae bacterium]|nr:tRNA guanosine(34) transglycosylase Tgt [Ignavibacteriota bacterium]